MSKAKEKISYHYPVSYTIVSRYDIHFEHAMMAEGQAVKNIHCDDTLQIR